VTNERKNALPPQPPVWSTWTGREPGPRNPPVSASVQQPDYCQVDMLLVAQNLRCLPTWARRGFRVVGRCPQSMPPPADWPRGPVSGREGGVCGPWEGCAVRGREWASSDGPSSMVATR